MLDEKAITRRGFRHSLATTLDARKKIAATGIYE